MGNAHFHALSPGRSKATSLSCAEFEKTTENCEKLYRERTIDTPHRSDLVLKRSLNLLPFLVQLLDNSRGFANTRVLL